MKSINLALEDTDGIKTGEMEAISSAAIQQEIETRKQRAIVQRALDAQMASNRIISYFWGRILEQGKEWKMYYDVEFSKGAPE